MIVTGGNASIHTGSIGIARHGAAYIVFTEIKFYLITYVTQLV